MGGVQMPIKLENPIAITAQELRVGDYIIDPCTQSTMRLAHVRCKHDQLFNQHVYTFTFAPGNYQIVALADTIFAIALRAREVFNASVLHCT